MMTPADRIKNELVSALARLSTVRRIASYGSIAEGRTDQWSDIDLAVACDPFDIGAWLAASAIRATKPVLYYRTFHNRVQPLGRYWFTDESPFQRLDISFYSLDDYSLLLATGMQDGHPQTYHEEHVATDRCDPDADCRKHNPARPVVFSPTELDTGGLPFVFLEAIKAKMRGRKIKWSQYESGEELRNALASPECASFGGGDFAGLVRKCLALL
jgi:hypothetical protein